MFASVVTAKTVKDATNMTNFIKVGNTGKEVHPKTPKTTRITMLRDGGVTDEEVETRLRRCPAREITMEVRSLMEKAVARAPQIIDGAWSRRSTPGSRPVQTGNFSFTFAGDVPLQTLIDYMPYFIKVLLKGVVVPGEKWTFAHIVGVPTKGEDGLLHSNKSLTEEVRCNPVMEEVVLCSKVHWRGNILTVVDRDSAAAILVYVDRTGAVSTALRQKGLVMFGQWVRCDISGESP